MLRRVSQNLHGLPLSVRSSLRIVAQIDSLPRYCGMTGAVKPKPNMLPQQFPWKRKRLAEPRIAALRSFLNAVESESAGALF